MPSETASAPRLGRRRGPVPPRVVTRRPGTVAIERRDVVLVANGRASGIDAAEVDRAAGALTAAGARVHPHRTASLDELTAIVAGADGRRVVLAGGDGTVHALANLGLPALPGVGLLPAGRANNIARALGIPTDWRAAARLAVHGRPVALDALRVTTPERRLFAVEGVSAGFHAAARHRYRGENSADLAAGVRALAGELWDFGERRVDLWTDGRPRFAGRAAQIFLANLPYFGFGFEVDPHADPSDGRLEAIVLTASTRREVIRLLAAAREGRHLGRPGVTWAAAGRADLREPLPLVADAVPLGVTTATVEVVPAHLRIVAEART
jgi:diacylglycerol kinase family enzyme